MFFYMTYDKIQSILNSSGLLVDITVFTDFEKVITFISFNLMFYLGILLFLIIAYKIFYKIWNFIF